MKFSIHTQVGRHQLTIEDDAEDPKDFFRKAAFLSSLPKSCGNCNGDDIIIDHRRVDSFEFFEVRCLTPDCNHVLPFGQYKDGKGLLFAKQWKHRQYAAVPDNGGS